MTLIGEALVPFEHLTETHVPDGTGGSVVTLVPGETFSAAAVRRMAASVTLGETEYSREKMTVITHRETELPFHALIRRISDGAVFRILSDGRDNGTPSVSALDLRVFSAERWEGSV